MSKLPYFIQVALPVPLYQTFDYTSEMPIPVGSRVCVPFGPRLLVGVVTGETETIQVDPSRIKAIHSLLDSRPWFTPPLWQLLEWAADYYQYPWGGVLNHALPTLLRQGEPAERKQIPCWQLAPGIDSGITHKLKKAPRQQEVIQLLQDGPMTAAELREQGLDTPVIKQLIQKDYVIPFDLHLQAREWLQHLLLHEDDTPYLNTEQAAALAAIRHQPEAKPVLLEGVTGSGKTEIYLQLIADVLAQGKQVLVMVPEIGLTPQLLRRFRRRFTAPILTLHSAMNDRERLDTWLACAQGEAAILIGTRSAIFTPFQQLGLIVIDEEHDGSFKQQDGFRYHGRDMAIVRARLEQVPIILGTATPSLETLHNALQGRYQHLILAQRAGSAKPAEHYLLDIKNVPLQAGVSPQLLQLMNQHLEAGNQVMLFLNRRGYAPSFICHDCGWVASCPHCDAYYSVHLHDHRLHCHHCDHIRPIPQQCPHCQSHNLVTSGVGTEQLETFLNQQFPAYKTVRIDRDNTKRKGELEGHLNAIRQNKVQIMIGTQMLAKGHHFPDVTLVGILDVDAALFAPDFRATEHLAQLFIQVAGRAGRASKQGIVVLQSHHPENVLLQDLLQNGYPHFARTCLLERKALSLPPFGYQVMLRANALAPEPLHVFMEQAAALCRGYGAPDLQITGPITPQMEKRAGRFRMFLMLQCTSRAHLQHYLQHLRPAIEQIPAKNNVRWVIDVDPQEISG